MGSPWREPILGWRLWRLRPDGLRSWAARCYWEPGTNSARCLSTKPCPQSPGKDCRCGFWALFSLTRCLEHARLDSREQMTVVGLVQGWGEVALHGNEGFRAARAAVVALFPDWVWDAGLGPGRHAGPWWWRLFHADEGRFARRRTAPDPNREPVLSSVAALHAVPLLPLADALGSGFLAEVGVDPGRCEEVRRLLERRAWAGGAATDRGTGHQGIGGVA